MRMNPEALATRSPEALSSFLAGHSFFRSYLGSGDEGDLVRAQLGFANAERSDPAFSLATYHLAIVETELRNADAAIARLETLRFQDVPFRAEACLQLAYAYTKRYSDADYYRAAALLNEAEAAAGEREDLLAVVYAMRAFVYAVMGGRLADRTKRPEFLNNAVAIARSLLGTDTRNPAIDTTVEFEAANALGIALMRQGDAATEEAARFRDWDEADRFYQRALSLRPNNVRVIQNQGTLHHLRGDYYARENKPREADDSYRTARSKFVLSIQHNSLDQFPHYQAAVLSAKLGEWELARAYYTSGRSQLGAVSAESWKALDEAITSKSATGLK